MKRLSTSLLIFILALLAVPDRAWAWTSVELRGTGPFDWTKGTQMTKINDNSFTYEFAASENFNFKFYVSDHNGFWLGYYDTSSQTVSNYDGSFEYLCSNINSGGSDITFKVDPNYTKYRIDLLWNKDEGGNHYFKYTVTGITEGGSSDPVSTYKLMMGDGKNKGTQVATFTGTNFPYTATYNIDAADTYYFYVNDGAKDYLNADQAFSDGTKIRLYQYGTSNYSHAIKLDATTTGTYTFTFAQETSDYSITCTYPTSTGEPDPTPTPTPILGNNFYLVGDLFDNETSINYNTRCFKFTDNGDNTYSLDIPATLTVKAQILSVDGSTEKVYGPSTGQNGLSVSGETLSDNGQITDALSEVSKTPTYFWNFQDRTLAHDGIYTITITLNSEGVPGSWTIKHDKTRRVAYYLSNSAGSTAQAAYAEKKDNGNGGCDNKFFGSVFLSKGTGCYVISNITKEADSNYNSLLKTTTKFYLQGNSTGGSPVSGKSTETKVFPVKYNGSPTSYKPFVFSNEKDLQLLLEYNPSQGEHETASNYSYIGGEVLRANYGDASGVQLPEITSMKIVGPAVNNSWNLEDAVPMTYNDADNCWEAIINTSAEAGGGFRFVANNEWKNSWQENGTIDADKARIPYDGTGTGHAATTADPNEVSYINTLTSEGSRDVKYDIIFNRDHGTWRVRFYIETQSTEGGNKYNYVFKYTINGYKSVLRTYCSNRDEKPTDESIKIYGAYAFKGDEATKSGTIKLYEMNYIPKNEGVILYSANVIDEATIAAYTPKADETMYKKISDDKYKNYLVGTLDNTTVTASEFVNNVRTHRNFFFNYFSKSGCYTDGATDYLGFFRIKSGSTCKANHAYLSLPTSVLTWNGQILEQVMKEYEENGVQAELTKGMRIVFSDGSDWVEDVPTSITTIKDKNRVFDNYYYTLQGVRVEKPLKGIYIHNGKKVVIK